MTYDFACDDCRIIFQIKKGMNEKLVIKCPKCNKEAYQAFLNAPIFYIRGNGYLDREGCRRDMDLYALTNGKDPYKRFRQRGEKDELINNLRKAKKFNPKRKYI